MVLTEMFGGEKSRRRREGEGEDGKMYFIR
jgi:hypothetical protein